MGLLSDKIKGLFSRNKRDVEKTAEEMETLEFEEEALGAQDLEELPGERSLINRIMLAYDKKSKVVSIQNAYLRSIGSMVVALKAMFRHLGKIKVGLKMIPKKMGVGYLGAKKKITAPFGYEPGGSAAKAREYLDMMRAQLQKINGSIVLTKARESPVFRIIENKLEVLEQQRQLLEQYIMVIEKQMQRAEKEKTDALKIVGDLEEEARAVAEEDWILQAYGVRRGV